jgi:hypothetical protein
MLKEENVTEHEQNEQKRLGFWKSIYNRFTSPYVPQVQNAPFFSLANFLIFLSSFFHFLCSFQYNLIIFV